MKKLVLATAMSILSFAATESYAYCALNGYVERVNTTATGNRIFVRLSSLHNIYYYGDTTDIKLVNAANNALTSRTPVYIRGGASTYTCPTTGAGRNIGAVNLLIVAP